MKSSFVEALFDMKEIQVNYPSYFLNAGEFIQSLQDFNSICKAK